jgi:alpha-mannosidase
MDDDVWLVPHTHWDREWYEPFQRFRLRLVDLMDDVTARGLAEPGFRFTLDGQMAAVEDYLEVRPDQRGTLRDLVASGQLAIGPWRVLMDEFLCSGETMIRNLEMGWTTASALGDPMPVGYLPDMFGHCAQMPQILLRAGLAQACVWRGVPERVAHHEFLWRSPDGSAIRTEYLPSGYGNAADLFLDSANGADVESVRGRLVDRMARQRAWFGGDAFLAMYGTDHAAPLPSLMQQVGQLGEHPDGPRVRVATLRDYLAKARTPETDLMLVEGELRSHARANILPGVLSVRWHLKDAMARTERVLARYAEPFAALWLEVWPQAYLDLAWGNVVDSSCHDSVTGCGVDETALQVAARIAEGEHAAQAVRDRALAGLARHVPEESLLVVNPLPAGRVDQLDLTLPAPTEWPAVALATADGRLFPTQELGRPATELAREQVPAARLAAVMGRVHDRELFGLKVRRLHVDETGRELVFHVADRPGPERFDAVREEERVASAVAGRPGEELWTLVIVDEPRRRLVAEVDCDGLGWSAWTPQPAEDLPGPGQTDAASAVGVEGTSLASPLLRVDVLDSGSLRLTAADGTVLDGVGALVDGGDRGDSYNYGPPAADRVVDTPDRVEVRVVERGPLRAALEVVRGYRLPTRLEVDGSRSTTTEPVTVTTRVELRRSEPFVRLALSWENRSSDHRLRLLVPLARPTSAVDAEGQLAVVRRPLTAEGGTGGEFPLPTYPAERFVDAGGAGVLLARTMEHEVVDTAGGQALALTLLRSIGYLSRNVHPHRDEPAGPQLPTPQAQCLGPATAELAVLPHAGGWEDAALVGAVEAYLHPAVAARGASADPAHPAAGVSATGAQTTALCLDGPGVVMTSLRRRDAWLELRVVAESTRPTRAVVSLAGSGIAQARRCDLLGRPGEPLEVAGGEVRVPLGPWEIATVQFRA